MSTQREYNCETFITYCSITQLHMCHTSPLKAIKVKDHYILRE